jgi:hypothetical protein
MFVLQGTTSLTESERHEREDRNAEDAMAANAMASQEVDCT